VCQELPRLMLLKFWSIRKGFVHLWTSQHSAFVLCRALRNCRGHCPLYEGMEVKLSLMCIHGLSLQFLTGLDSSIDVLYTRSYPVLRIKSHNLNIIPPFANPPLIFPFGDFNRTALPITTNPQLLPIPTNLNLFDLPYLTIRP
jgi:hypothetical protein